MSAPNPGVPVFDGARLIARLRELGDTGRDAAGRLCRLAGSDADRAGRDLLVSWLREAGLDVTVDAVGNIFGLWQPAGSTGAPVMLGSHIDTVIDAGIYDGCYGVLAGLGVIEALMAAGRRPACPLAVAAFTNEEGVRYAPDMLGSLVHAGGLSPAAALATRATDGPTLGEELARIGYAGPAVPGAVVPRTYLELHIEQGPVLDREGVAIGVVGGVQGISWQRVTVEGAANHAGTTPMSMRRDAGLAAARTITFLRERTRSGNGPLVATVGSLRLEPDAINVIPARATFTIDMRDPDEERLRAAEADVAAFLERLAREEDVTVTAEPLARFAPVHFDQALVGAVEAAARNRHLSSRRMTSGAGHDAQMLARIAPAAMIFVPSVDGISHNPREFTPEPALLAGAAVLLDVVAGLAGA